jgi:hypothetical protein
VDDFTRQHLMAWLDRTVPEHALAPLVTVEDVAGVMEEVWSEDPDFWSAQGWPKVYESARWSNPEIIP